MPKKDSQLDEKNETTKDFKQKLEEEIELLQSIEPKAAEKIEKINKKYSESPE